MRYIFKSKGDLNLTVSVRGTTAFFRGGEYVTENNQVAGQLRKLKSFGRLFGEVTEKKAEKKPE